MLGFGEGNYQDALMQKLAQNGNGIAAYIDTLGPLTTFSDAIMSSRPTILILPKDCYLFHKKFQKLIIIGLCLFRTLE